MMVGRARFAFGVLAFGYAFLYLPIALVIAYSFNESRLVTVWAGFSTKWWSALFANEQMLRAAWLSLRIALVSATVAAVIGLAAGYVLARVPRFAGRTLFASLVVAPMVMVRKPRAGPPSNWSLPTNSSSMEMPITTSGMTMGAITRLPNRVRPRKDGVRAST